MSSSLSPNANTSETLILQEFARGERAVRNVNQSLLERSDENGNHHTKFQTFEWRRNYDIVDAIE